MEIFSIICLIVIIVAVQHLLNWLWRKIESDTSFIAVMLTVVGLVISWACLYHIILWGKNLI
jgi:Kef-type K+ transport system membrane component KefB